MTAVMVLTLGYASLLVACGSSGSAQPAAATYRACQEVSAVLSDGPDPTGDPVGYAEAQVQPLRYVRTTDEALRVAVDNLDSAYERMFSTNGSGAAQREVARASARLDVICPGAAP